MKQQQAITRMVLGVALVAFLGGAALAQGEGPKISNMRFEGLKIQDNVYVPSSEYERDYKILVDFESQAPIAKVYLQTRFANGRTGSILERSFEMIPPASTKGTLVIPSRILKNPMSRDTDWWVVDANGRVSNKLIQRVVIRD